MNANILQTLASNSPPTSFMQTPFNPSTTAKTNSRARPINSTSGNDSPPPVTPPDSVEIRFRRGSRRQRQNRDKELLKTQAKADNVAPPKKWEDMDLSEKAMELYVGEKGLLFWLNKFAYASIFIMIGAWLLFRFVGPSLNLYQLDGPPLSPSDVLKGS